jgi:hypothetical protein
METYEHLTLYFASVIIFYLINFIGHWIMIPYYFWYLFLMFPITYAPDLDKAFVGLEQSKNKIVRKITQWATKIIGFDHRSYLTHSSIIPIGQFLTLRLFLMGDMLYLILLSFYFPWIIHLLGDYKLLLSVADVFVNKKSINKEFGGFWQIVLPFGKRLGKNGSRIWLICNMAIMIVILILI